MNKIVNLSCMFIEPSLIIPMNSGVEFTNQTGGVHCNHPQVEGILIPVSQIADETIEKEYPDQEFIEDWIKKNELPLKIRMNIVRETNKKRLSHFKHYNEDFIEEAWIPVEITKISDEDKFNPLKDFEGCNAFLTYNNSD